MSALDPKEVERFGKLLGLLGSDFDGERAAAAAKATGFLAVRHLAWSDVTEMLKHPPVIIAPAVESRPHQAEARRCLASKVAWKDHEVRFLKSMTTQIGRLTQKQRDWLDGILDRVARYERESSYDF